MVTNTEDLFNRYILRDRLAAGKKRLFTFIESIGTDLIAIGVCAGVFFSSIEEITFYVIYFLSLAIFPRRIQFSIHKTIRNKMNKTMEHKNSFQTEKERKKEKMCARRTFHFITAHLNPFVF